MVLPIRRGGLPAVLAALALLGASTAHAESMKACSAKYQAAKTANTLNGQSWKDFRKAQCGNNAAGFLPMQSLLIMRTKRDMLDDNALGGADLDSAFVSEATLCELGKEICLQ